jgi:beta-N-acetylhexosaminidase
MTFRSNELTIEEKVGQLFFIGMPSFDIDGATETLLNDIRPGGICAFARNIRSRDQIRGLNDELRSRLPREPLLSIDQEGGLVDRLRRIMTPMPAASAIKDVDSAARLGAIVAETLRLLGFNMNFAPVVDMITPIRSGPSNGLASRHFGSSADDVVDLAGAFLVAMQNGGVVGCPKHFPGLGASRVDSHEELPIVDLSDAELEETDLVPYRSLLSNNVQAVMAAHAVYPQTRFQTTMPDGKAIPSSLSQGFISGLLRDELAFDGVVITDDLEMGAIVRNFGIGEACVMAVDAGVDMLAICASPDAIRTGFESVLAAVEKGALSEERVDLSIERIDILRTHLTPPLPFDSGRLDELSGEIAALK